MVKIIVGIEGMACVSGHPDTVPWDDARLCLCAVHEIQAEPDAQGAMGV